MQYPVVENSRIPAAFNSNALIKRGLDISASFILLIAFLPVMLIIAALAAADGGPAFFRHGRIGRNGVSFNCLKFRTMLSNGDAILDAYFETHPEARKDWIASRKLQNDPRVTFIGNLLRRSSLDELPQLINVLRGEMSLVGPRPIVRDEVAYYGDKFSYYTSVKPGLTGKWQTSGRSDTSYEERVAFDVDYVKNQSLSQDIAILFRTVPVVLLTRGSR